MTPDEDDLETFLAAQAAKAPLDQETDTETPPGIVGPKATAPASPVKAGPNLTPYGMEAPPEVSRDRLGEIASTILGAIAGKDKNARRAALAGGIANMISAKPGEAVDKENYDRKLLAARLASGEQDKQVSRDYMLKRLASTAEGRKLAETAEKRRQAEIDRTKTAASPAADAFRKYAYAHGAEAGSLDGLDLDTMKQVGSQLHAEWAHDYAPVTRADAVAKTTAEADARNRSDLAYAAPTAQARAQGSEQGRLSLSSESTQAEVDKQRALNPVLAERSAANNTGVGTGLSAEYIAAANPNLNISNPALLQQALKTRAVNQKTLDDIKSANRASELIDEMYLSAKAVQDAIAEGRPIDAAAANRQYNSHVMEYAGVLGKVSGSNSVETQRHAMDLAPNPLINPAALEMVKALWPSLEVNINGNLGTLGIRANKPHVLMSEQERQRLHKPVPSARPRPAQAAPKAAVRPAASAAELDDL